MDFNKDKSFEELLREKVEHHEFPFEAGSWAQMQSKLQAHHVQAAAQQTSLYKSILLKTGKVLVGVISGSAIVYSALSLSGMLDKETTKLTDAGITQQTEIQQTESAKPESAANTAILHADAIDNNAVNVSAEQMVTAASKSKINNQAAGKADGNAVSGRAAVKSSGSVAGAKHFSGKGYMQGTSDVEMNRFTAGFAKADAAVKSGRNVSKNNFSNAGDNNITNTGNKLNSTIADANQNQAAAYIESVKNASESAAGNAAVAEVKAQTAETMAIAAEADSVLAINGTGGKYPDKPSVNKPKTKVLVGFSGGANVNFVSSEDNNRSAQNAAASPMFGVHAVMPLSRKFALQAGAQYVSHQVQNVSHTSALVQWALVPSATITRTTITECRYMEMPVLVKFAALPGVNFYSGLRTNILIGAKSNVTEEQYVNERFVSSRPVEDAPKFARYNGLRSVDFGIPLGVEFALNRKFSVAANYNLGLTDFTNNQVFENTRKDRHSSWQVQLNFRPFSK